MVAATAAAGMAAVGAVATDASGTAGGGAMASAIAGVGRPSATFGSAETDRAEHVRRRGRAVPTPFHRATVAYGRPSAWTPERCHKEWRAGLPANVVFSLLNQPGRYLRAERRGAGPPKEYQGP